jgi:RsiW-degrading membrane proteinase PrsW (M82 family)
LNVWLQVFIFSFSPAIALAIYFYRKDKYEKEPAIFLIRAFLGGAIAALLALIIESALLPLSAYFKAVPFFQTHHYLARFLRIIFISFFVAGLVEEWCKYREFRDTVNDSDNFNEPFDGILYSVMIALGFATVENLGYVAGAYFKLGIGYMAAVGVGRALFSVPGHCCFAVIMGYYFGKAKFCREKRLRSSYLLKAFFYPIIAHGLFDFLILIRTGWGVLLFLVLVGWSWDFASRASSEQVEESPFKDTKE